MFTAVSLQYLAMGAFFGLTAGISPGPLLSLVITETLRHNWKEGLKIALSPLITDLPIILISSVILSEVSQHNQIMAAISLLGGIYFTCLGYETLKSREPGLNLQEKKPESLKKGIIANFLNPNPYIFWFTAGIPYALKAYESSLFTVVLYFVLFYLMLTGSKIIVAILTERSKAFIRGNIFRITMIILGMVLLSFAGYFFYEGIRIFAAG